MNRQRRRPDAGLLLLVDNVLAGVGGVYLLTRSIAVTMIAASAGVLVAAAGVLRPEVAVDQKR